jgi:hypothetical protein
MITTTVHTHNARPYRIGDAIRVFPSERLVTITAIDIEHGRLTVVEGRHQRTELAVMDLLDENN